MGFLKFIRSLFFGKDLADHLRESTVVKCHDIRFRIRRISPLEFMNGSNVMMETFAKYKITEGNQPEIKKVKADEIKKHFIDVFMASVMQPILSRKPDVPNTVFVEHLFTDWALANDLYEQIILFTYGKKKSRPAFSRVTTWSMLILFAAATVFSLLQLLKWILGIFS